MKKSFLLILFLCTLVSCNKKPIDIEERTVTTTGTASVLAQPNQAEVTFAIRSYDRIAVNANESCNNILTTIVTSLNEVGVNEKDIFITENQLSIEGGRYLANATLKVLIRNIKNAPTIIDSCMGNGKASELLDYTLLISDTAELEKQVRLQAIQNAYDNAKLTANACGENLGKVLKIDDLTNPQIIKYVDKENQKITLSSSVIITYELTNE